MSQQIKEGVQTPTPLRVSKFITWFVYAWTMFGVIMLLLRTFLLAASANLTTGFSSFVMRTSEDYLEPFRGIFPPARVGETGYLDVSALFAAITYLFIAWGVKELINYIQGKIDRNTAEQEEYLMRRAAAKNTAAVDTLQTRRKVGGATQGNNSANSRSIR